MPSIRYTVPELLKLRGLQSSRTIVDKLKATSDLGDIIKQSNAIQPRRLKKGRNEGISSTDSDDHIVFQGKRQSRLPANSLDGETQWKYRGRLTCERNSNEPIAAPTGLDAQQNEGFQRFFKAVVSPTHVRVTAGGRIVPNTRNTTSPTAKWDQEQTDLERDSAKLRRETSSESVADHVTNQQPAQAAPPMVLPPMAHPMYPGFHPLFAPYGAPVPFFPMPGGMAMPYGLSHMQVPAPGATHTSPTYGDKRPMGSEHAKHEPGQEDDRKCRPAPIQISPPEQFDQSRPYLFNGNVFYPSSGPLPMQGLPTPMTPSPYFGSFPLHPAVARVGSFSQPSPGIPISTPHGLLSPSFASALNAGPSSHSQYPLQPAPRPDVAPVATGAKPPVTSIKPSQITQSQLSSLRSQLKFYGDQLQFNKHQIDEKATQEQIQTIRKLIGQFEHNYQMQLNFEKTAYPQDEKRIVAAGSEMPTCGTPSTPSVKENLPGRTSHPGSIKSIQRGYPSLDRTQSVDQIRHKSVKDVRQRAGINSSKGMDTTSALGALEAHLNQIRLQDPIKKSSLPTRAAMAPIFEPRRATPSMPLLEPSDLCSNTDASRSSEVHWNGSREHLIHQGAGPNGSLGGQLSTKHLPAVTENSTSQPISPYLVGRLPQGWTATSATSSDYIYSRDLTDEEKRSRDVYFGGVPSKESGLPKFNGKSFYPPSPMKSSEKNANVAKESAGQVQSGYIESGYTSRQTKPEDPFHIYHAPNDTRSSNATRRLSHAVPIINPQTMTRENVGGTSKASQSPHLQDKNVDEDRDKTARDKTQVSPTKTLTGSVSEVKSTSVGRRELERSSRGSSNDLWQNMMKKAPTSGLATPGFVSSTNANGFLPQFTGHVTASLSPAVTNANSSLRALSGSKGDDAGAGHHSQSETMEENRPPLGPPTHADIIADLHQRMLRDAERRGVIGPGWQ